MGLFTFVLEYGGGTYLSQVRAENFAAAPKAWADELNAEEISDEGNIFKIELLSSLESENPTPLDGLVNTWCLSLSVLDELALVHYCQTVG